MTTTTSRRTVLAGAAALSALAASAVTSAAGSSTDDPIFAAIERHKTAFLLSQTAGRIDATTVDVKWAPEYDPIQCAAVKEASSAAYDACYAAAYALTTVQPSTMAGVLALIRHVEAFNAGAFFLVPDAGFKVADWQSGPMVWPPSSDKNDVDLFGYWVLANVRRALEAMSVQS